MNKKELSKVERPEATEEMFRMAEGVDKYKYIATAKLMDFSGEKILLLNFFKRSRLVEKKSGAEFRTFLSRDDYITQDLKVSKVKWLTASFTGMEKFSLFDYVYDVEARKGTYVETVIMHSNEGLQLLNDFFSDYSEVEDEPKPWRSIYRFQESVKEKRLDARRKKETDLIDAAMEPIKEVPQEFVNWVWETGMSFSRYLIYKEVKSGKAECECTHCNVRGVVDRRDIRLRNNEKGICPFCGSRVTIKAIGKMPSRIIDERWFLYVDPTPQAFTLRYFKAVRDIRSDKYVDVLIDKSRVRESIDEYSRAIYSFPNGKPKYVSYEWGVYKQRGRARWCPDKGNINCMDCILYPGNLPQAWEHTPMKYSALEVLSANIPTVALRYEDAINKYLKFPKLEWICKMGLNSLAKDIINERYTGSMAGKVKYGGKTIYEILGLTKINTKVLQAVDGNHYMLRLLQVSQQIGYQFKPEQLKEYYETFECNTDLLKQANRKVSLHKLVKYITKESERYPLGKEGGCWQYAYMRYKEREDPRIERKRNMAKDWLEYLDWCKKLKYDLNNMFIYMPTNFKKVHDRTYEEYQEQQERIAAEERKRREREAAERMRQVKKYMEEIFKKNANTDAFAIAGKGLMLMVPKSLDEIKAEGASLHHCVGTYINRVARGETMILFVRKAEEPEESYFTLEYKNGKVVQCRGRNNCAMTKEVQAFVMAFEKKMNAQEMAKLKVKVG